MNARIPLLVLAFVMAGVCSPAAGAERSPAATTAAPIDRFLQVDEGLYRGGQPDEAGFKYLKELGVRTVISLREDPSEAKVVESLGMRFVHIPITMPPFTGKVPAQAVSKFFATVDDPTSGPVFVHCRRGADRTGTLVGLYRVTRQHWSAQRAYDEARTVGMRWWYSGIKDFLAAASTH